MGGKEYSRGYLQSLKLERDDCAMACDNEPECKSFQVFTDKDSAAGRQRYCMLMHKDPRDVTMEQNPSEFSDVEVYVRPTITPPNINTRLFAKKNAEPPSYTGLETGLLDGAGLFTGRQNGCGNARPWCDVQENWRDENIIYPTGMLTAAGGQVGAGKEGMMQYHTGVRACSHIPGVVTNTVPTNAAGNDQPNPDCRDRDTCNRVFEQHIYCGYRSLNNDWIIQNWDNLQSHLASTIGNTYTAPQRPGTPQAGIFQVDSVKVAKGDYCNTVPLSAFVSADLRPITKCKQFKEQEGGSIDSWYQFILQRTQKEDWRPVPKVIVEGCKNSKTSAVIDACVGAIGNLTVSETLQPDVVLHVNEINEKSDQSPLIVQAIQAKVDAYCEKHQNSLQCACRNAVKLGIANCKPGIPGCEDMVEFQKLRDVVEDNTALAEFIKGAEPRSIASACVKADASRENTIFQYGKKTGNNIELNNCILKVDNEGGTINDIYQKCYTKTQRNTGDGAGGGGAGAGDDEDEGNTSAWVWILLIAVIFLSLIGVAGIGIFALS